MEARFEAALLDVSPVDAESPRSDSGAVRLRIAGYNTWALPLWLPGLVKHQRLPQIPGALGRLDADVIALQEAFDVRFRRFTLQSLGAFESGEGASCEAERRYWGKKDCTGGLLTLSRFPIIAERFHAHELSPSARLDERMGGKGLMMTTIMTGIGPVEIANIHLYAGRAEAAEEERMGQISRFAEVLGAGDPDRPVVIVGDLNLVHPSLEDLGSGLPPSKVYRFLVDSLGFVDTRPQVGESDLTYDGATNQHADVWYNRFEGRQAFDYIMYRVPARFEVVVEERTRVLEGPPPLSDHYGTFAQLQIRVKR
jgi:endonuclease/exonuclease/phosphatase family metal-dependent hydrolase